MQRLTPPAQNHRHDLALRASRIASLALIASPVSRPATPIWLRRVAGSTVPIATRSSEASRVRVLLDGIDRKTSYGRGKRLHHPYDVLRCARPEAAA
jgi:hypothetical protein